MCEHDHPAGGPPPQEAGPDANAVWVAVGGRTVAMAAVATACLVGFDALAIRALVTDQAATAAGFARVVLWVVVVGLSLFVPLALLGLVAAVRERHHRIGVDRRGVWWVTHRASTLLPWEDVLAVRLLTVRHPARSHGLDAFRHHLEIYPRQRPNPRDRELGSFVRQAEPAWPGLPPSYWQIELGGVPGRTAAPRAGSGPDQLTGAVRHHRPQVWAGTVARDHGSSPARRP